MPTASLSLEAVRARLVEILDPEMPVNIVDLGIVEAVRVSDGRVEVDIVPTFVGCPALDVLRERIREALVAAGATDVVVRFRNDPAWSVDRISDAGREALRRHGVGVPQRGAARPSLVQLTATGVATTPCPFCGSSDTTLESPFGPTRCRMIYYCRACRNSFEQMKPIG